MKLPLKPASLGMALLFTMLSSLNLYAQQVNISVKNTPVREILKEVTAQTGYNFVFNDNLKEVSKRKDFEFRGAASPIRDVLDALFKDTGIAYTIRDKQVVLTQKQVPQKAGKRHIRGRITDETGESLTGVAVRNEKSKEIVLSDLDGQYGIEAGEGETLFFSFLGMETYALIVGKGDVHNVSMRNDVIALQDVVVTGYQTISRERATGSYAVITPKEIEHKLQTNVMDRLEGYVPGLNIVKNGSKKTIQIRGVTTINGNQSPLFIVDGVPFEGEPGVSGDNTSPLDLINPADIVNITILKDATAASIYGARSANGVIVISTKSGQKGKTRVHYSSSVNFQGLPDRSYSHLMTSEELVNYQMALMKTYPNVKRQKNRNFQNPVQVLLLDHKDGIIDSATLDRLLEPYRNQDRYDQVIREFLRKQRITHQHNLSLSGGSDIYKYSISFNYTGGAPYEKAQYLNRYGFNVRNSFDFFPWLQVDANIMGSVVHNEYDNGILGMDFLNTGGASYYMLRDEKGEPVERFNKKSRYEIDRLVSLGLQDESYFPVNELHNRHYTYKTHYLNVNLGAKVKITDGLNFSMRFQRETTNGYAKDYQSKNYYAVKSMINDATQISDGKVSHIVPVGGQVLQKNIDNFSYTARGQVDYAKDIAEKHKIQALVGAEIRKVVTSGHGFYRLGYDDDNLSYSKIDELAMSKGIYGTQSLLGSFWFANLTPPTTYVDNRYVSFYGNASYIYNDRLNLSASIRMDQSNLFGTDPKYQYRPLWSAGAQYVVLQHERWIDRLVVRATYGINGNIPKLNGPYLIAGVGNNNYYTNENTMYIASPPNASLRWEKTKVFNIGVDFNFFGNRLNGSVEFYNKNTSDLLGTFSTDPTLGWDSVDMNFGSMYNRGIELSLNSVNIQTRNFSWTTLFNFSYNKNKITEIESSSESAYSYWSGLNNRKSYPMGSLFSVRYKGLNEKGAPVAYKADGTETLQYSSLTKEDLVYSGTYNPPYHASLSNTLSYGNFDFSFMLVYAGGHVMRDIAARYCITSHPMYAVTNTYREMANYWKQPGDEKNPDTNPAFMFQSTVRNGEYIWKAADKHIRRGDFIKLRDVSLAYRLPKRLLHKTALGGVKVMLQARNLCWWASNGGKLDPEVWTGATLSPSRGIAYPAEFTVGLNINF